MEFRYKKITIKIGSNVLTKPDGTLNVSRIAHLVDQISFLRKNGVEIIVVSSGAVAAGKTVLNSLKKSDAISSRQLWSALGQVKLINRYTDFFNEHGIACAQVLTTKENFSSRAHYLNMKNCIRTLLENNIVPIVNENDAISITELMFTDNDELSGLIASMENSEALIILTNVDGIFNGIPGTKDAKLIEEISDNGFDPEKSLTDEISGFGRGGMITKFRIARKVAKGGIAVHIVNGKTENILVNILDGSKKTKQTYFVPEGKSTSDVKRWIAYSDSFAKSKLIINEGARKALFSKKAVSLLPVGITQIEGTFRKGDLVKIYDEGGEFIGIGKARYNSDKIENEKQAEKQKPVIHYDYLYLEDIKISSGFK
ncbi:MAG: glutamate 5-kinase [Mariniphaga sp.]|nr:glutamate 5-kinase [Mariniphaga sp.]